MTVSSSQAKKVLRPTVLMTLEEGDDENKETTFEIVFGNVSRATTDRGEDADGNGVGERGGEERRSRRRAMTMCVCRGVARDRKNDA